MPGKNRRLIQNAIAVIRPLPRPLLMLAAAIIAAASLFYGGLWIAYENRRNPVELGFDNKYLPFEHCELVQSVVAGSPAERARMRRGDRIIRVNGSPLAEERSLNLNMGATQAWRYSQLSIERAAIPDPLVLCGHLSASWRIPPSRGPEQRPPFALRRASSATHRRSEAIQPRRADDITMVVARCLG